jgi:hypothetical protein
MDVLRRQKTIQGLPSLGPKGNKVNPVELSKFRICKNRILITYSVNLRAVFILMCVITRNKLDPIKLLHSSLSCQYNFSS